MKNRLLASITPAAVALLALTLLSWGGTGGVESGSVGGGSWNPVPPASRVAGQPSASWRPAVEPTDAPVDHSPGSTDAAPGGDAVALGYFIPGAASDPTKIDEYAKLVGSKPRIVMWYQSWAGEWSAFSARTADAIHARGAMPMISWEPTAGPVEDRRWSLRSIINGSHDGYIKRWLRDVAVWGQDLYVRPMYEMNGWWASWCAYANGNTPAQFVAAWRHIVDLAREAGAMNIRWVWSPNVDNDGLGTPFADVFPGDDYVDWVGLDGFNRGTSWSSTRWQTMTEIFTASIEHVRELSARPLMIAETASSEVGGDKAAWIRTSLARVATDLPEVRAVIWFSKNETSLGIDWRVNSSAASLKAFRALARLPEFGGRLP